MADDLRRPPPRERVRQGIAYVCENLAPLREHLRDIGQEAALDRLLDSFAAGGPEAAESLAAIDQAVRSDGDARGAFGHRQRGTPAGPQPVGVSGSAGAEVVFLCPANACPRHVWAHPDMSSSPMCSLADSPLRWVTRH